MESCFIIIYHNNISIDMCVRKIFKCSCIIFKYRLVIHIEYQTDTTFYFITANLHISGKYTVYSRRLCTICFWYHDWCIIFNGNFCEVSKNWSYLSIKKIDIATWTLFTSIWRNYPTAVFWFSYNIYFFGTDIIICR